MSEEQQPQSDGFDSASIPDEERLRKTLQRLAGKQVRKQGKEEEKGRG